MPAPLIGMTRNGRQAAVARLHQQERAKKQARDEAKARQSRSSSESGGRRTPEGDRMSQCGMKKQRRRGTRLLERASQTNDSPTGPVVCFMERWLVGWLVVQYLVLSLSVQVELLIEVRGAALFVADDAPSVVRRIRRGVAWGLVRGLRTDSRRGLTVSQLHVRDVRVVTPTYSTPPLPELTTTRSIVNRTTQPRGDRADRIRAIGLSIGPITALCV